MRGSDSSWERCFEGRLGTSTVLFPLGSVPALLNVAWLSHSLALRPLHLREQMVASEAGGAQDGCDAGCGLLGFPVRRAAAGVAGGEGAAACAVPAHCFV